MMILLYQTEQEAQAALTYLEDVALQLWAAAGYTVDGRSVIGKHSGMDNPEARILRWDTVQEHPDGGYYFTSPRVKYAEYFDQLVTGDFQEMDYTPTIPME